MAGKEIQVYLVGQGEEEQVSETCLLEDMLLYDNFAMKDDFKVFIRENFPQYVKLAMDTLAEHVGISWGWGDAGRTLPRDFWRKPIKDSLEFLNITKVHGERFEWVLHHEFRKAGAPVGTAATRAANSSKEYREKLIFRLVDNTNKFLATSSIEFVPDIEKSWIDNVTNGEKVGLLCISPKFLELDRSRLRRDFWVENITKDKELPWGCYVRDLAASSALAPKDFIALYKTTKSGNGNGSVGAIVHQLETDLDIAKMLRQVALGGPTRLKLSLQGTIGNETWSAYGTVDLGEKDDDKLQQ